jgi:hypothetical protein
MNALLVKVFYSITTCCRKKWFSTIVFEIKNLFLTLFTGIPVECVRINKVSSPQSIESGSSQSVILDCQFEINKTLDEMLVLKW